MGLFKSKRKARLNSRDTTNQGGDQSKKHTEMQCSYSEHMPVIELALHPVMEVNFMLLYGSLCAACGNEFGVLSF